MNRPAYGDGEIYCCGGTDVFLIDVEAARKDPAARVWSWKASDSARIPAVHQSWFANMDECKPVLDGEAVLVASSSAGGVALIRRADKKCLFYAGGRNAHSAELLPGGLLAGAFSYRCDELRLYRLADGPAAGPVWTMSLSGAHGVVWDRKRELLWALGGRELLKLKVHGGREPSAEVLRRWDLPKGGGHDLFTLNETHLVVTVNRGVYQFDVEAEAFSPMPGLADLANVKSLCRHPVSGQVIYTQGERIFTSKVRFVGADPIVLPPKDLYKARWNAHNSFSYAPGEGKI